MADAVELNNLLEQINTAFSPNNIKSTVAQLSPLSRRADFLDIVHSLGFLAPLVRGTLSDYREELTIPGISRRIMTTAFRASLLGKPNPIPLKLLVEDGDDEAVKVITKADYIIVELTRTVPHLRRKRLSK